jgi:hypothetical protein
MYCMQQNLIAELALYAKSCVPIYRPLIHQGDLVVPFVDRLMCIDTDMLKSSYGEYK